MNRGTSAVRPFVMGIAGLACVAVLASLVVFPVSGSVLAIAAAFAVAVFFLQSLSVPFPARGQRFFITLEESVVYLALLVLPLAALAPLVAAGTAAGQARSRRAFEKAAFNVGVCVLGAAVAALVALALAPQIPPVMAAILAALAYTVVSDGLVAVLLARLGGASSGWRLAFPAAIQAVVGTSLGVTLYLLWLDSPWLTLLVAPILLLARWSLGAHARMDRELRAASVLDHLADEIARAPDIESAIDRILGACGEAFPAGRVSVELTSGRTWDREFDGGAASDLPAIASEIRSAHDGAVLGRLRLEPGRRNRIRFGEIEALHLKLIARHVSTALSRSAAPETQSQPTGA
jgi:hypothetical protein